MNRSLAIIVASLLSVAPATARAQGGLGIKGGVSYGNVSHRGVLPGNLDARTGFAVGVSVRTTGGLVGFGAEALYAQRGVASATDGDSRRLDYVDVPAYLRVMIPTPGVAPYAYAGPQFSFEVRCRGGTNACPNTDRPKTSYAAAVGGGVRFGGRRPLSIEGRYVYGLTDLKLSTLTSSESYKTRSFLILAGLGF